MEIEKALRLLAKRADEVEVFCAKEHAKTLEIKGHEIDLSKESTSVGFGVRVIVGGKMGFAFSGNLDGVVLDRALDCAKIAERDAHLGMPDVQKYGHGGG
ncbi:hypothetical protein KKA03_00700, partial [archaeon]|nr:hypothetical protein [archaeon]